MKTNFLPGNFPAVWLLPENQGNPYRYGEIDVVEFLVLTRNPIKQYILIVLLY